MQLQLQLFSAVGAGGLFCVFGEGAVELGQRLKASVEGDVGDPSCGLQKLLAGPVDAGAREVIGKGQADGSFEKARKVGLADAYQFGGVVQVEGLAEVFLDVLEGFDDGGGDAAFDAGGEVFGLATDLFGKDVEQRDHVGVALGIDGLGL